MDALLGPQHVTFLLDEQRFQVIEFSESGFSLSGLAAESWTIQSLGFGREASAGVAVTIDGIEATYDVTFRVASLRPSALEVALITMPSELRFRLRHAAQARERLAAREQKELAELPAPSPRGSHHSPRQLILDGSARALELTLQRRADLASTRPMSGPSSTHLETSALPGLRPALTSEMVGMLLIGISMVIAIGLLLGSCGY